MKKIIVALILSFCLSSAFGSFVTLAWAESMNFKLVSMVEKMENVQVSGIEGVIIGVLDRKGLSLFENGDIATTTCRAIFDTKKGFQGYSTLTFKDGSTVIVSWEGPASAVSPGSPYRNYSAPFEYVKGTGRFEGIKGSGSFSAKAPLWDKDFKAKGFTYYEFNGNYNLSSK